VVMPQSNGWELAECMRETRPGLRVMFMSGHRDALQQLPPAMSDATVLQKPFSLRLLSAKVREVLGQAEKPARILVVDDDASIRHLLVRVLEVAGYEAAEACDGKQAMSYLNNAKVDAVITDLVMPEQEGIETIRQLRERYPELKIIAISGAAHGAYLDLPTALGADLALAKPIHPEVLLERLRALLASRSSRSA